MKFVFKALVSAIMLILVCCAAIIVMMLISKRTADLYGARVKLAFNAATLNYESGAPETTVISGYAGQRYELNPDNYRVVSFYVRQGAVKAYLPRNLKDKERLDMTICNTDEITVYKLSEDSALAVFKTSGETMKMKIHVDGLWKSLVEAATAGDKDSPNTIVD